MPAHYTAPADFSNNILCTDSIIFSNQELLEYLRNYFSFMNLFKVDRSVFFVNKVHRLTGCLPGLVYTLILYLNEYINGKRGEVTEQFIFELINSTNLIHRLRSTRAFKMIKHLSDTELNACKKVVYNNENYVDKSDIISYIQKGVLVDISGLDYKFANSVLENYIIEQIGGSITRATVDPIDLKSFLHNIIRNMNYENLKWTYLRSCSNSILLERSWQMEFYLAAIKCSPKSWLISADVGSLFNSTGSIDFYRAQ